MLTTKSLNPILFYLRIPTQSVRTNNSYSKNHEYMYGIAQSLVLGTLLFNINLIVLFFEHEMIILIAMRMTPFLFFCKRYIFCSYKTSKNCQDFIGWYENNNMKVIPQKSRVLLGSNIRGVVPFYKVQITIQSQKLLGITFDLELKFEERISKFVIL